MLRAVERFPNVVLLQSVEKPPAQLRVGSIPTIKTLNILQTKSTSGEIKYNITGLINFKTGYYYVCGKFSVLQLASKEKFVLKMNFHTFRLLSGLIHAHSKSSLAYIKKKNNHLQELQVLNFTCCTALVFTDHYFFKLLNLAIQSYL